VPGDPSGSSLSGPPTSRCPGRFPVPASARSREGPRWAGGGKFGCPAGGRRRGRRLERRWRVRALGPANRGEA